MLNKLDKIARKNVPHKIDRKQKSVTTTPHFSAAHEYLYALINLSTEHTPLAHSINVILLDWRMLCAKCFFAVTFMAAMAAAFICDT